MLQDLRDQKNSGLIVFLFAVIILVFVFMFGLPGADTCASKKHSDVGQIGSHSISYEMLRSQIMQHYDDNIFSSLEYSATARDVTLGLGVIYLLADNARDAGMRVSDDELKDYLTNWESGNSDVMRYFLHQNKFSQQQYNNALNRFQLSARDYEDYKRTELLARRYLSLLASSISVSEDSLWQAFAADNAKATIEAVRLTNESILATLKPLTEDEISAFETSGNADIQTYYDEHQNEFTTPAKVKMQQIIIQKNLSKLTNPGAKTVKTQLPNERAAIAKGQIDSGLDFDQAFVDYDESENKDLKGMTGLLSIDIMADEIQAAVDGKAVGTVFMVELSDRYVIGKIAEKTEKIVAPLDEVKHDISSKIQTERRVKSKLDEVSANLLALVKSGKSMDEALNETLYANVLVEQPVVPVPQADDAAAADAEPAADDAAAAADAEPAVVAVPTDMPIVPDFLRVKARMIKDITPSTGYIEMLGVNDDLARDIRNSAAGTVLDRTYEITSDIIIARVVEKKDADREMFNEQLETLRAQAIAVKTLELIGNQEDIIELKTNAYGIWLKQMVADAESSKRLTIDDDYFNRDYARRLKQKEEREKEENQ